MKKFISLLCTITLFLTLAGCSNEEAASEKDPLVKTSTVSLGAASLEGSYPGTVKGRYETNMSFQVGGRILERYVQAGDMVQAGDILMTIDTRDVQQQTAQADAQVNAAAAQLELARANLNRYSALYEEDAVPASVLDQYRTTYDAAMASYKQAAAAASQSRNSLGYTNLTAASDGVISAVSAEAGQVVAAGQTVATLIQSKEPEVEINVPESRIASLSIGQEASCSFWSLGSQSVAGIIREISPMADKTAGTYRVRISLPDPPQGLYLGMTATISISDSTTAGTKALLPADKSYALLPLSAIYQTGDTPNVWLVDKDSLTLSLKPVRVEGFGKEQVQVYGLAQGDIVVTAGVHKLREGTKVRLAEDAK